MSLSRSQMWIQRLASPTRSVDRFRFSNQRILSFCSIGTRVGFTDRFSALVILNLLRVQNLIAVSPSGKPSTVTARLECIRMPHSVCCRGRPSLVHPVKRGLPDRKRISWKDPKFEADYKWLQNKLPGMDFDFGSHTNDEN